MSVLRARPLSLGAGSILFGAATVIALVTACSSSNDSPGGTGGNDSGVTDGGGTGDTGSATCASPGQATPGPADTHCQGQPPQPVDPGSCQPGDAGAGDDGGMDMGDAGDDGGAGDDGSAPPDCEFGATLFGHSGVDDDCKYKVSWTSDPICEGSGGVQFTVTLTSNVDGKPVTGIPDGISIEAFIPTTLDAACDNQSTHPTPGTASLKETAAGSGIYKGPVVFDAPGQWTVRFHIHEECADLLDTSPHGHAAFRVTVP